MSGVTGAAALSPKENLLRALRHEAPHHVPYEGEGAFRIVDHAKRKPPREDVDAWGVTWGPLPPDYRIGVGEPLESFPVAHPAQEAWELAALPFPVGEAPAAFAGLMDGIDTSRVLVIGRHGAGPFDRLCALLGMPGALTALLAEPDAAQAALNRIADYHVAVARSYLAAGVGAGFVADDYAGQDGPMLRPAVWRRMILPGLARIIAVYRVARAPVFFHTCGRSEPFIADLLEAGVTAFNLESTICGLVALKRRYGPRIGFLGGVGSAVMQSGAPTDVVRAAERAIADLWTGGGLILAPDQPLHYPEANVAALVGAAQQVVRYDERAAGRDGPPRGGDV